MEAQETELELFLRLKQVVEPGSHPVATGYFNIPFVMGWTAPIYLAIAYFKCLVVFGRIKYRHLWSPLSIIAYSLNKVYVEYFPLFPPKKEAPVSSTNVESLFAEFFNHETQLCLIPLIALAIFFPESESLLDFFFLAKSVWHILYMYRKCPGRFYLMSFLLFCIYNIMQDLSVGVSLEDLCPLYIVIILVCFCLPEQLEWDAVAYYGCLVFYITYINFQKVLSKGIYNYDEMIALRGPSFWENLVTWITRFYNVQFYHEANLLQDSNTYMPAWIY